MFNRLLGNGTITNIRYILITALRDWLFVGLLASVLLATAISATLGSTAFLEEREMTLTFASGSSRLIVMIGIIVFVCFHIRNAFDTKEIDVILSRPISRGSLMVAYWLGFSVVGFLLTLPVILIIGLIGVHDVAGFAAWVSSFILETWLVVALALFCAFTLRSVVTSVIACMGFYVLSRMMAFFVLSAENLHAGGFVMMVLKSILIAISSIVPRLDFFTKSDWLILGVSHPQDVLLYVAQAVIFVPFLLAASMVDFRRKQF